MTIHNPEQSVSWPCLQSLSTRWWLFHVDKVTVEVSEGYDEGEDKGEDKDNLTSFEKEILILQGYVQLHWAPSHNTTDCDKSQPLSTPRAFENDTSNIFVPKHFVQQRQQHTSESIILPKYPYRAYAISSLVATTIWCGDQWRNDPCTYS